MALSFGFCFTNFDAVIVTVLGVSFLDITCVLGFYLERFLAGDGLSTSTMSLERVVRLNPGARVLTIEKTRNWSEVEKRCDAN